MKNLPQYSGKTDGELLILARNLAIERLRRHMERLQRSRVGTRKYYAFKLKRLEQEDERVEQGINRPRGIMCCRLLLFLSLFTNDYLTVYGYKCCPCHFN